MAIRNAGKQTWLVGGLLFLLAACHTNHLSLDYKVIDACYADSSSKHIAFFLRSSAYYQAKGVSKFPDGGAPKYVYNDISLFVINTENNQLERIVSFKDLAKAGFNISNSLNALTIVADSVIYFRIKPITPWNDYLKWSNTATDSMRIISLKDTYATPYRIHLSSKQMLPTDSLEYYSKQKNLQRYNQGYIHKKLDSIELVAYGLDIMKINPKPEDSYIEETIFLDNGSPITRRAVIEQIISKLSKDKIRELIIEMDTYKKSLEGIELKEYEIYSKDIYQQLQSLL